MFSLQRLFLNRPFYVPRLAVEKWEQAHRQHVIEYLRKIDALYDAAIADMVRLGMAYPYDVGAATPISFNSGNILDEDIAKTITALHDKMYATISAGVAAEWAFANAKTDSWVTQLFADPKRGYMLHNLEALKAFQNRKTYGHTLSRRVWDYAKQFQQHIELSISVGLSEGRSAQQISKDVRLWLNEPDKLFRRVRNRFGELVLSKAARLYHPGQGVYRSSYQNAMRLARTEINMSYRECDSVRWQQLDFIVGIEVKRSKTHAAWLAKDWIPRFRNRLVVPQEICDTMAGRYPKDFKFIGWHPNCRCYAVPILANEDNDSDFWDIPQNVVTQLPKGCQEWMKANKDRIAEAQERGKLPYWLKENAKMLDK